MNTVHEYILQLTYVLPFFSALNCGSLIVLSYDYSFTRTEQELKRVTTSYLFFSGFSWLVAFLYAYFPLVFVILNIPALLFVLYAQVFIYRIFHILTRISDREQFPFIHYIMPLIPGVILLLWGWDVPDDVKIEIVLSRKLSLPGEYEAYSRFFTSKPLQRLIFSMIYIALSFRRIIRYYRRINDPVPVIRKPAAWVWFLCLMVASTMVSSLVTTLLPRETTFSSFYPLPAAFAIMGQHVILCYILLRRNYVMYITFPGREHEPVIKKPPFKVAEPAPKYKKYVPTTGKLLNKTSFDAFMRKEKPFLDPGYKLTQLVDTLEVNRTYISKFINNTYGMNFNRLMNHYRIMELNRLRELPSYRNKSLGYLLGRAGFSNYKQYRRAMNPGSKQEETGE